MNAPPAPPRPQPASLSELFWSFTRLALQGFGGVLAVVQLEMVERKRWLTQEEFVEDWAVAQILPGPNVVNLSMMLGARYFGLRGALTALAGMLALPMALVLLLALVYAHYADQPALHGALRGMAAVSAGLIGATGMKMAGTLKRHPLPPAVTAGFALLGILCVAVLHWPMFYSLATIGGLGCVLTYRRLRP